MKYKLLLLLVSLTVYLKAQSFTDYTNLWTTYVGPQGNYNNITIKDDEGNIYVSSLIQIHNQTFTDQRVYNYYKSYTFPISDDLMFNSSAKQVSYLAKFSPEGQILSAKYLPYQIMSIFTDLSDGILIKAQVDRTDLGTANVWLPQSVVTDENKNIVLAKLNEEFLPQWITYVPDFSIHNFVNNFEVSWNNKLIDVDDLGNIYCVSRTIIDNGVTTPNAFYPHFTHSYLSNNEIINPPNAILYKLTPNGELVWSTYYGTNKPHSLFVKDNVVYVGFNEHAVTSEYFPHISYDAALDVPTSNVLAKFNANTGERLYATYFGEGNLLDSKRMILVDNSIYMSGETVQLSTNTNLITSNVYQSEYGGGFSDLYLAKLDLNFNVNWGTYIGGNGFDLFDNLKFFNNHLYIISTTTSSNFLQFNTFLNPYINGEIDAMVMKFNMNGGLIWGTLLGGDNWDGSLNIEVADEKNFYLSGWTYSENGLSTPGSHLPNLSYLQYSFYPEFGFLAKFGEVKPLSTGDLSSASLKIYPNPTKDKVYIKGFIHQDSWIEVYNLVGQKVITQKAKSGLSQEIEVQFLPKGTYIIKATDINGKPFQEKLMIK